MYNDGLMQISYNFIVLKILLWKRIKLDMSTMVEYLFLCLISRMILDVDAFFGSDVASYDASVIMAVYCFPNLLQIFYVMINMLFLCCSCCYCRCCCCLQNASINNGETS